MTTPEGGGPPTDPDADAEVIDIEDLDDLPPMDIGPPLRRSPIREVGPAFDLSRQQEKIRGRLALILTFIFGILVLLPLVFWYVLVDLKGLDINAWLQTALPAVTALLGSAMGFYFGTRST